MEKNLLRLERPAKVPFEVQTLLCAGVHFRIEDLVGRRPALLRTVHGRDGVPQEIRWTVRSELREGDADRGLDAELVPIEIERTRQVGVRRFRVTPPP